MLVQLTVLILGHDAFLRKIDARLRTLIQKDSWQDETMN